jgi:hypothetical protein
MIEHLQRDIHNNQKSDFGKVYDVPGACLSLSRNILVAFWPVINPAYNIELQKQQVHDDD